VSDDILEYVFFHTLPREGFVKFLLSQGLSPDLSEDEGIYQVSLPENIDDELSDAIEDKYDEMMALNRELFEEAAEDDELGYQAAGISLALKDGSSVYADVDPMLLARIMESVTPDEFNTVVNAIVTAVEDPDKRSICQRLRDEERN